MCNLHSKPSLIDRVSRFFREYRWFFLWGGASLIFVIFFISFGRKPQPSPFVQQVNQIRFTVSVNRDSYVDRSPLRPQGCRICSAEWLTKTESSRLSKVSDALQIVQFLMVTRSEWPFDKLYWLLSCLVK